MKYDKNKFLYLGIEVGWLSSRFEEHTFVDTPSTRTCNRHGADSLDSRGFYQTIFLPFERLRPSNIFFKIILVQILNLTEYGSSDESWNRK